MPITAIREFLQKESASGLLIMGAAVLAMMAENSPLKFLYDALLETLRRGDATAARDLMSQHIRHSLKLRQEQGDLIPADAWWRSGLLTGSPDGRLTFQG